MSEYSYQTIDTQELAEWIDVWPIKARGAVYQLADRPYGVIAISARESKIGLSGIDDTLSALCANNLKRLSCAYFDFESLNFENTYMNKYRKLYSLSDAPCYELASGEVWVGDTSMDLRGLKLENMLEKRSVDVFALSSDGLEGSGVADDVARIFANCHGHQAAPSQDLLGELLERYAAIGYVQEYRSYSCYAGYLLWARCELLDVLAQRLEQAGVRAYGQQKSIFQWVGA